MKPGASGECGSSTTAVAGRADASVGAADTRAGRAPGAPSPERDRTLRDATADPAAPARTLTGYQLRPGQRVGELVLEAPLGRGGMGEVWRARDLLTGRLEAVKVLLSVDVHERERQRFIREATAALDLGDEPGVVRTYGVGADVETGRLFLRMELVSGESLDRIIDRDGPLPPARVLPVLRGMAEAVAAGHRRGIVHRDVKPSNFMLTLDGRVKLVDFGLARGAQAAQLTRSGDAIGTPAYMSLEQWDGAASVDARADVYSLGVTYYNVITGRLPFEVEPDGGERAYYAKLRSEDPAPLGPLPELPPDLAHLVMKAMAKRPAERFASAVELLAALDGLGRERIRPPETEAARARRRRLTLAGAAVMAVALVAGGTALGTGFLRSRRSLGEARQERARASAELALAEEAAVLRRHEEGLARSRAALLAFDGARALVDAAVEGGALPAEAAAERALADEGRQAAERVRALVTARLEEARAEAAQATARTAAREEALRREALDRDALAAARAAVDAAADEGERPGRSRAAVASLEALLGAIRERPALSSLEARAAAALAEARRRAVVEGRALALTLLARGETAEARDAARDALLLAPSDARLRDLARYATARALAERAGGAPGDGARVIVPPAVLRQGAEETYVAPFAVDAVEVTQGRFLRDFVARGGYDAGPHWDADGLALRAACTREAAPSLAGPFFWGASPPFPADRADHPVTGVSLAEARAFARLTGGRLPTLLEWRVAAGLDPASGEVRERAFVAAMDPAPARLTGLATAPTGGPGATRDASPLGVMGLGGNVAEWVEAGAGGAIAGGSAWSQGKVDHASVFAPARPWRASRRDAESVGFRVAYDLPEITLDREEARR